MLLLNRWLRAEGLAEAGARGDMEVRRVQGELDRGMELMNDRKGYIGDPVVCGHYLEGWTKLQA